MRGDRRYDELVEAERAVEAEPCYATPGTPEYDERVKVVRRRRDLYEELMWNQSTTPEEVLAGQLASNASLRLADHADRYGDWWATVRWPWGDARGRLKVKGRTYSEAQLRLRDRLVASARSLVAP